MISEEKKKLVRTPETLEIDEAICEGDSLVVAGETLTNTGDYEFHITTFNGCDSAIFVSLEVLPQASDFVDVNICNGNSFFVGQTPYTQTGIYTDTLLTMEQCDSVVTLDLFVIECEIIGSTNFTAPICHGEATGTLVFSVENGTPPFTYDWSHITNPGIGGTGSTNLFVDNEIFNVPKGIYEINIMDTFGNDVVLFQEVTEPPPLSIEMTAYDLNGFNLSCYDGSDGTASAIPSGGVPSYSYSWDNGSSLSTAGNLTAGPAIVFITDAAGCEQSDSINLIAPPPIEANVLFIDSNCDGIETGMVILDSISGGTPPYTYSLGNTPFSNTDTYTDLGPGTYTFTTMDANDCQALIAGTTSTPSIPIIDLEDDLVVQLGCDIAIPAVGANINQVLWTDGAHLDCDTCLHPFASPIENSTYQVIVSSIDDCTATASINISVDKVRDVYFPNAFSPNGDGINDVFFIGAGKAVVQISSLQVYSRWGERVYEGFDLAPNDPLAGWDGIFKNEKMNPGLFLWTAEIEFLDGFSEQYGGDILLMK